MRETRVPRREPWGFTLLEMTVVIVALGILLPAIFLPFLQGAKGANASALASAAATVAQSVMEQELARIDTTRWPTTAACSTASFYCAGTTLAAPPQVSLNGYTYSSTVTEKFCDSSAPLSPSCTNAGTTINNYLVVTVTTSGSGGGSITLQTMKTADF